MEGMSGFAHLHHALCKPHDCLGMLHTFPACSPTHPTTGTTTQPPNRPMHTKLFSTRGCTLLAHTANPSQIRMQYHDTPPLCHALRCIVLPNS